MKLDFLADNGLKVGDKVKLETGHVFKIIKEEGHVCLRSETEIYPFSLSILQEYDFEKVEEKEEIKE